MTHPSPPEPAPALYPAWGATLPAWLAARARLSPDAPAHAELDAAGVWRSVTWAEHQQAVRALAAALAAAGLAPGERVLLLAPNRLAWERVQMAALGLGAVVAGVDPRSADAQLQHIARRVAPALIVVGQASDLARLPAEVTGLARLCLSLSDAGPACLSLADLMTAAPAGSAEAWPLARSDDPALIVFTSGTTGEPRAIAYTHRQVCLACEALLATFPELQPGDRFVCWLPLANLFQRMVNFFALRRGVSTYFVEDPRRLMELLAGIRPHLLIGVPRFFEKLYAGFDACMRAAGPLRPLARLAVRIGEARAAALRRGERPGPGVVLAHALLDRLVLARFRRALGGELRFLISGSAPMPVWLLERLHALGLIVLEAYGTSEDLIPIAANRLGDFRFGTVGRPLPGNEVRLDAEGELEVRGPGVFGGYLDDADRSMFTADGFLRTGDYAEWAQGGRLRLKGRRSEVFKTSTGRRVAPHAIEQRLLALPWVEQALAAGAGRKFVLALLAVDPQALGAWAREQGLAAPAGPAALPTELARSIWHAVQSATAGLSAHERPAGCALLARPFSVEAGELTPNLKLRRQVLLERFGPCLDRLNADVEAGLDPPVRLCP